MKSLAGTWEQTDDKGQKSVVSVFAVSSDGSVVREIMFPGTPHEMTNVYHLDGPSVVMTHYCAEGNQPRMRATGPDKPGAIALKFDSVSNLTARDQQYMGELTLLLKDKDHIVEQWTSFKEGKKVGGERRVGIHPGDVPICCFRRGS